MDPLKREDRIAYVSCLHFSEDTRLLHKTGFVVEVINESVSTSSSSSFRDIEVKCRLDLFDEPDWISIFDFSCNLDPV